MEIVAPSYLAVIMLIIIGDWLKSSKKSKGEAK